MQGSVHPQYVDSIITEIGPGPVTARAFATTALGILKPELHAFFNASLERVLTEIPVQSLGQAMFHILQCAGISAQPEVVNNLVSSVEQKKKGDYFTPYALAKVLRKALIFSRPSIYLPSQKLENAIRATFGFPQIIDLGNRTG